jgi:hypothetical protein
MEMKVKGSEELADYAEWSGLEANPARPANCGQGFLF